MHILECTYAYTVYMLWFSSEGDIDEVGRLVTVYMLNAFKGTHISNEDLKVPSSLALILICI